MINPLAFLAVIVAASTATYLAVVALYGLAAWIFDFNMNWWAAFILWIVLFLYRLGSAVMEYYKDDPR